MTVVDKSLGAQHAFFHGPFFLFCFLLFCIHEGPNGINITFLYIMKYHGRVVYTYGNSARVVFGTIISTSTAGRNEGGSSTETFIEVLLVFFPCLFLPV